MEFLARVPLMKRLPKDQHPLVASVCVVQDFGKGGSAVEFLAFRRTVAGKCGAAGPLLALVGAHSRPRGTVSMQVPNPSVVRRPWTGLLCASRSIALFAFVSASHADASLRGLVGHVVDVGFSGLSCGAWAPRRFWPEALTCPVHVAADRRGVSSA